MLGVSPALIEGYVAAAAKISRLAVGDPSIGLDRATYRVPGDLSQDAHIDGLPLGTRGGIVVRHTFPLDAEYDLQVGPGRSARGSAGRRAAGPRADDLYVTLDGARVDAAGRGATRAAGRRRPAHHRRRSVVRERTRGADGVYDVATRTPGITQVTIAGPFNATGPGDTPSRRRLLRLHAAAAGRRDCRARAKILSHAGTRAYRRPVAAIGSGDRHAARVLSRRAASGHVRVRHPAGGRARAGRSAVPVPVRARAGAASRPARRTGSATSSWRRGCRSSCGAASRTTSCWTWRRRGALKNRRRSSSRCAGCWPIRGPTRWSATSPAQWLYLRELQNARPDSPDFDGNLRQSFQRETELLFRTIMREDRSIIDLLDADFTFVDERLARHYGIPGIRGIADAPRRARREQPAARPAGPRQHPDGDVGRQPHVAGRSAASGCSRTARHAAAAAAAGRRDESGEGRGAGQGHLAAAAAGAAPREPACASCHKLMDPIGFALENFDHAGKWRTHGRQDADRCHRRSWSTARRSTARIAAARAAGAVRRVCRRVAAEKMLTYAVGPGDAAAGHAGGARDRRAPRRRTGYRFSSLVLGVVKTPQFQMRTKAQVVSGEAVGAELADVHHQEAPVAAHVPAGHRRVGGAAAARLDGRRRRRRCGRPRPRRRRASPAIYVPHGATMDKWTPATEGAGFEFTEILKPLEPFRERVNVVSGLAHPYVAGAGGADVSAGANHTRAAAVFLTGVGARARRAGAPGRLGRSGGGASTSARTRRCRRSSCRSRSGARLRGGVQLRLSQLDLVEVADRSRCRCRTIRGWCSRSCSATAAPTPSAARGGRSRAACSIR